MAVSRILEKLGFVRHTFKKDLLFFFLPWLTVFSLELGLCRSNGDGISGLWAAIWQVILRPLGLFALPWPRAVGLSLFIVGLTLMLVAQVTLWENYSGFVVIKKGHQLITHGIYRYTRNPIYLGALMAFAGLPAYAASLYGFLMMLANIPIFLFRIRMEEKMLSVHFGDEYEAYRNTTKRLIPFLY